MGSREIILASALAAIWGCSGARDSEPSTPTSKAAEPMRPSTGTGPATDTDAGARGLRKVSLEESGGDASLGLRLQARARIGGEERIVAPGDTLHSGDRMELLVDLDDNAFVYVAQFFADGTSAVLFPDSGDVELNAGVTHRIPERRGEWFELDESTGEENIYVIASRLPLAELDQEIAETLEAVRTSGSKGAGAPSGSTGKPAGASGPKAKGAKRPAPRARNLLGLGNRGTASVGEGTRGMELRGEGDGAGVLVVRFSFQHR